MRRVLAVLSLAMLAGSCETMSADECRVANWQSIGYQDGAAGETLDKYTRRETSCAKAGITPDFPAYAAAREDGLKSFCRPERGFRAAVNGYTYAGACPAELEGDFLLGYNDGRIAYDAQQAFYAAESEANSLRSDLKNIDRDIVDERAVLRDDKATAERKEEAQRNLDSLQLKRRRVEKDLDRAEKERFWRQTDLDRTRSDLSARWGAW